MGVLKMDFLEDLYKSIDDWNIESQVQTPV